MSKLKGETYRQRCDHQLELWLKGEPVHNDKDGECCPDFSCCQPDCLMNQELRTKFGDAVRNGDDNTKMSILGMALGGVIAQALPDKKVHITGDGTEGQLES